MHILVTGGAGFIGSNFVRYLLNETTHDITTLDALTYAGSMGNLEGVLDHPRHEFIQGDVRDMDLVSDIVSEVDAIVNFAAESHVDRSIQDVGPFVSTNVQGTQVLLDVAQENEIDRFLQVSTDEVYGSILEGEFTESDPLKPRNPYAASKAGADLLALSYYKTHGLPVLVARSSNNYGPRQHTEKLIPKFITSAKRGRSLPVYGDGTNVREWTYVRDNCRAIELVLSDGVPGDIYNIGSNVNLQNIEVAQRVLDAVGASEDLIEFVDDRPGHDQRYALDATKIRELGWEPKWSFDEGLKRTVDFYLDQY